MNEHYVDRKFENFKEEISNYEYINIKQFNQALVKANQYMHTVLVKSLQAIYKDENQYKIARGTAIPKNHLISVIPYTDYSDLSADFTATFRRHGPFDSLSAAKNRNERYWWWSKTLLETVQVYGKAYHENFHPRDHWAEIFRTDGSNKDIGDVKWANGIPTYKDHKGPFYSGMAKVLDMPQFNIQLFSPTSTSVDIEVAMKFCGESGIIIEVDNSKVGQRTRLFDVSWISRFPEENERYMI